MFHATRAMEQAQHAPGNRSADARLINGVHHTLSVWDSRDAMRAYLVDGAHLQAMKVYRRIGTGKTYGYETDKAPSWEQALELFHKHGREV